MVSGKICTFMRLRAAIGLPLKHVQQGWILLLEVVSQPKKLWDISVQNYMHQSLRLCPVIDMRHAIAIL